MTGMQDIKTCLKAKPQVSEEAEKRGARSHKVIFTLDLAISCHL